MKFEQCVAKIDRYLVRNSTRPLIINVQNQKDLESVVTRFYVDGKVLIRASEYCNADEFPRIELLLDELSGENKDRIVLGLTSFLKFEGKKEVADRLKQILDTNISGHALIITYQCEKQLHFSDPRRGSNICFLEGGASPLPKIVFVSKPLLAPTTGCVLDGIDKLAEVIEETNHKEVFVITKKKKALFPHSMYMLNDREKAYDVILEKDDSLAQLDESIGTESQWNYLLKLFEGQKSFEEICDSEFKGIHNFNQIPRNYLNFPENKQWLYFVALKILGTNGNCYLKEAVKRASSHDRLIRELFRSICVYDPSEDDFLDRYKERKQLLKDVGNPSDEVEDFCKFVLHKERKAIYYLTDNTLREKEEIIAYLGKYYGEASKDDIQEVLSVVYPDLCKYLRDYEYDEELFNPEFKALFNSYFSLYNQCKVVNRIDKKFEDLVNAQAVSREYNLRLRPRADVMGEIDKSGSELYFMDAMGIEYLPFILAKCFDYNLMAEASICRANLPTITSINKEFVDEFKSEGLAVTEVRDIDDLKHNGMDNSDYTKTKQPIHLIKELEVIADVLEKIKSKLNRDQCERVIMASDHGASRLAVIHETEALWEMQSKGKYSGRCCPKSDADVKTEFATEENGFWVLANYDRFRGGRKAIVEVHGGASLEEVVVPIIQITKRPDEIEVVIEEKVILVSYKKDATITLFSKTKLKNVAVKVDGAFYEAEEQENNKYLVRMPKLKKAKQYDVEVYSSNNLVASGLSFEIRKESSHERDLF